jgi:hypothetical protein
LKVDQAKMMSSRRLLRKSSIAAAAALSWAVGSSSARATALDDIGVTQLRLEVPTLTGAGVVVAQPEGTTVDEGTNYDHDNFEINKTTAGINSSVVITYIGNWTGHWPTTTFDSTRESSHAGAVALILAGGTTGVAPDLTRIVNYNANYYLNYVVFNSPLYGSPLIVNQSFIEAPGSLFTTPVMEQFFDNFVAERHYVIVTAAGNSDSPPAGDDGGISLPGTAYNVVTVGAYQGSTQSSALGLRCKPDIVAPGGATSFATPYVSGVAALLVQAASSGNGVDPRVVKTLLLNGATKPSGWTHSSAEPLDHTLGAGLVNAYNSYNNLTAGEHTASCTTATIVLGGEHLPVTTGNVGAAGWNLATINSDVNADVVDHYVIDLSQNNAIVTLTATLAWQRANDQPLTDEWRALGSSITNFTSSIYSINNLDLYLYNAATQSLVDLSNSAVDNVEHLYTINLTPGKYDLQVLKNGGSTGTANVFSDLETYGLAWNAASLSSAANTGNLVFNQSNNVTIFTSISGTGTLTQSGIGTTTLAQNLIIGGKIAVSAGRLAVTGDGASHHTLAIDVGGICLTGGTLDLKDRDGVVRNVGHTINNSGAQTPVLVALTNLIHTGAITSSTATPGGQGQAIGYGVAGEIGSINILLNPVGITNLSQLSMAAGALGAQDLVIRYTGPGDVNLDGSTDGNDLAAILNNMGNLYDGPTWWGGDLNGDGSVDGNDLIIFINDAGNLVGGGFTPLEGTSTPSLSGTLSVGSSVVPEPTSLTVLALSAIGLLLRRQTVSRKTRYWTPKNAPLRLTHEGLSP